MMDKKRLWNILKTILKLCFTVVALYWVFRKVNLGDLKEALVDSNPLFLALAFLAYTGSVLIASSRLNGFFKGMGLALSEQYNFKLYLLGSCYNLFLPGGVGGDGYKIYFLRRKFKVKGRQLLSAVFFDRLSGLWALCLITAALVVFIPRLQIPNEVPMIAVAFGTVAYYAVLKRYFPTYSKHFFLTHLKALGVQSMQVVATILILYALHFDGKFSPYLLMFLLSSLVAVIPFSAGGLGLREVGNVYGAQVFDLDPHLAVLISLLFYCISAALAITGSYFIFHPQGLGEDRLPTSTEAALGEDEDENE